MDPNVGGLDRIARIVGGVVLLAIGYRTPKKTAETLAFVAGADLLATAAVQRCPVNALFGIDTCT